eukprot:m.439678 g.439678  ORF g.439678 m.439678 type:complete len:343 (-) comp21454_c0_seq1:2096-3124(-)
MAAFRLVTRVCGRQTTMISPRNLRGCARSTYCTESGIPSAAELDKKAMQNYRDHPRSHGKLLIEDMEFRVGKHFVTGDPAPELRHKSNAEPDTVPGVLHVTPWARAGFCWLGERGNLGKASKFTKSHDGYISDPMEAQQEVSLMSQGLSGDDSEKNTDLLQYFEWLNALREGLIEHLTDNVEQYPSLMKKFGILVQKSDRETLREMIASITTKQIKYGKDEYGYEIEESPFLPFRQKMYYYSEDRAAKAKLRCELDIAMQAKNCVRKHIPVYDWQGVEIPLEQVYLGQGDIVSIENNVLCQLYDVGGNLGAGLKRNIRSVVILRRAEQLQAIENSSPFGDLH